MKIRTPFARLFRMRRRRTRKSRAERTLFHTHKEHARSLVHERLEYWNQFYQLTYKRVAIRDQRSRWGSCSTKSNLNFNYRLIFLPIELVDYVIVHELCHLKHFNHGADFWATVAEQLPDYEAHKKELHHITKNIHEHIQSYLGQKPLHESQKRDREISDTVPA